MSTTFRITCTCALSCMKVVPGCCVTFMKTKWKCHGVSCTTSWHFHNQVDPPHQHVGQWIAQHIVDIPDLSRHVKATGVVTEDNMAPITTGSVPICLCTCQYVTIYSLKVCKHHDNVYTIYICPISLYLAISPLSIPLSSLYISLVLSIFLSLSFLSLAALS
jgi:hypothetical protein